MAMTSSITYEMVTLDDDGNLYRRMLILPPDYTPEKWVLDRISHEDGIFQVSDGDFVNSKHIARLSFRKAADEGDADSVTRDNYD